MVVVTLRYIKQTESLASLHKQQQHTRDPHYEIIVCIMKLIVSYHEVCIMKNLAPPMHITKISFICFCHPCNTRDDQLLIGSCIPVPINHISIGKQFRSSLIVKYDAELEELC
jgi:hypothetical protein